MALMKCVLCGNSAGNRTKAGDWVCGKCIKQSGKKWLVIRNMPHEDVMHLFPQPVKTKILDHGSGAVEMQKGGLGRAVVGGVLAGGAGAIIGANTGKRTLKSNSFTAFKVWFDDGHTEIQKVPQESELYLTYLNLLEE